MVMAVALIAAACAASDDADTTTTSSPSTTAASTTVPVTTVAPTTGGATTTTTSFVPFEPGYGGEAIIGDDQEPPTLNPFAPGGDNFIVSKIAQALHVGVLDIDGSTLELIPELITEVPTVANGGLTVNPGGTMTVRYQIREEAVWANGVPISGHDLEFTYRTLAEHESGDRITQYPLGIVPGSVVAGDKTFEYALEFPTVGWEGMFGLVLPEHQVEGSDFLNDWNTTPWVSGGPFVFDSWEPGGAVRLIRNENYWKTDPETGLQLPYLDAVEFRWIPETAELIRAFRNREVDVINPPPFMPEIESIAELPGVDLDVRSGPIWEHFNFQFGPDNRNTDSLNRHVLFRRAVAHALDRDALAAEATNGYGSRLDSYLDAFTPGWSGGAWARYDHDPQRARDLLGELCSEIECPDPPTVVFSTTSNGDVRIRLAGLLEEQLEAVGIDVVLDLEDSSLFFGPTLDDGTYDMGLWAWVGSTGLAGVVAIHDIFDPDGPPPEGSNFYRWGERRSVVRDEHTARFAEVRDAMNATVDRDELLALIAEAEEILADQVVIIPIYSRLDPGLVWADEIGGYVHNPSQAGHTWNVEYWYRVDR
jgi:peptide/nickel transport system substrate-binding protein